jgi:hypothetical protein
LDRNRKQARCKGDPTKPADPNSGPPGENQKGVEAMKDYPQDISIVDFAYQIIAMNNENNELHRKVEHLEELNRINGECLNDSANSTKEMIGTIFSAVLDPKSAINKGNSAIIELEMIKDEVR